VFVARAGVHELTTTVLAEDQVRDLVEKMLKSSGRRVDLSAPFVDAMLPDGSRLHVVIPDITRRFWSVNIRKFVVQAPRIWTTWSRWAASPSRPRVSSTPRCAAGSTCSCPVARRRQAHSLLGHPLEQFTSFVSPLRDIHQGRSSVAEGLPPMKPAEFMMLHIRPGRSGPHWTQLWGYRRFPTSTATPGVWPSTT
jgi:hypothetical protein